MRRSKNPTGVIVCTILLTLLTGCGQTAAGGSETSSASAASAPETSASSTETADETEKTSNEPAVTDIIVDFRCGSAEAFDHIKKYPYEYGKNGEALRPEHIAEGLSHITGYDFSAKFREENGGIIVDWSSAGSLVTGSGENDIESEFFMFSAADARWLMLDSMWANLSETGYEKVYYLIGGEELSLPEMLPFGRTLTLPADCEYNGSSFYVSHATDNESGPVTEDEATDILLQTLGELPEGQALRCEGADIINDIECYLFSAGDSFNDRFTVTAHYAVSVSGAVFEMDITTGEYSAIVN